MLILHQGLLRARVVGRAYSREREYPGGCHIAQSPPLFLLSGTRSSQRPGSCPADPTVAADRAAARLDLTSLDTVVQELFYAGIAPSTWKTYQSGSKRYVSFCNKFKIHTPFPVTEKTLTFLVAYMYKEKLSGGTVKSYLAAVRHIQIALGLGDPHMGRCHN